MSLSGTALHTYSGFGTAFITAAVGVAVWWADSQADDAAAKPDPYADMEVIDAALAEKAPAPVVQPQKQFRPPPDPVKPEGVSRDADAKPVDQPKDEPTAPVDINAVLNKHRADDEELPVGPATQPVVGAFDGSDDGWGDETRGDPYLGALKSDLLRGWEFPEILSEVGTPIGCIHLEPDGTIPEYVLREKSGNAELDDSVERALEALQKRREKTPKPVPTYLVPKTRKWICYRMKV
ncbi:MAG: TonB C-terminal domain-containing protein [Myxococcales bacterium]|nr:TonB C-terminal domain-containing protein [Myxococcales bacterium]